jgi:hypothetical protein
MAINAKHAAIMFWMILHEPINSSTKRATRKVFPAFFKFYPSVGG